MSNKKITMQDIANILGITKVSVSKAINDKSGISDDLRKKILETANKMNYIKPETNHSKSSIKTYVFVAPRRCFMENEQFYSTIYFKLNEYCNDNGVTLVLALVDNANEENGILPAILTERKFDGCFVEGEMSTPFQKVLATIEMPMVTIDYYSQYLNADCVITDNYNIGYVATEYLISNGHRDIGFIGAFGMTASITDRIFGYRRALVMNGIEYRDDWMIQNIDSLTNTYTIEFDLPEKMPTAFVCHCDFAAYILIKRLLIEGIRVPDDISVVAIDNTYLAQTCNPPLTAVDISIELFVSKSFEAMSNLVNNPQKQPERIYINTHLIERSSDKYI